MKKKKKINRNTQEIQPGVSLITEAGLALAHSLRMPGSYQFHHLKIELNPQSYTSRYEARRDIYPWGPRTHAK